MESTPSEPTQRENVQNAIIKLNEVKSMPAGEDRTKFIQEQFDAMAKIISPAVNRSTPMGNETLWQFVAEGEGYDLAITIMESEDSITVNPVIG